MTTVLYATPVIYLTRCDKAATQELLGAMNTTRNSWTATKLPQVTLAFWIMKISATTLGETGGDLLAQTLNVGYAISTLILLSVFLVTLVIQLRARKFSPALYWTVIVSTSTAGTTISDYMDRTLKLGYFKGTLILITLLVTALTFWKVKFGSISIARVDGFELELMYWTTILCSNTLGTALGDYLSDSSGLGFGGGALLISSVIALVALLHFRTQINKVVLFWAAFVLTRPLGATVGDLFTKSHEKGGLGFGTYGATAVLIAVLVGMIIRTNRRGAATPRRHTARRQPVVTAPAPAATSSDRDLTVKERWMPAPSFAEVKAEATEVKAEATEAVPIGRAIDELDDELVALLQNVTGARRMLESARRVHAEAVELRARAERQAAEIVARAKAEAAQRTDEAERRFEELRSAETAVLDRLQQAAALWETVFHNGRPAGAAAVLSGPPDIETLDLREASGITASRGNGAH